MFRRTLMTFAICLLALAAVASAQPTPASDDLLFHKSVLHGRQVVQTASRLFLPAPSGGWASEAEFRQASVQAAQSWMVSQGYLLEGNPVGVDLVTDENGNDSLVIAGSGIHMVIILPNGPFLPHLDQRLLTATTVLSISNGF